MIVTAAVVVSQVSPLWAPASITGSQQSCTEACWDRVLLFCDLSCMQGGTSSSVDKCPDDKKVKVIKGNGSPLSTTYDSCVTTAGINASDQCELMTNAIQNVYKCDLKGCFLKTKKELRNFKVIPEDKDSFEGTCEFTAECLIELTYSEGMDPACQDRQ